jgi:hypothetical protein
MTEELTTVLSERAYLECPRWHDGRLDVDPDGSVTEVADDLWFPNGSVITDDGVLLVDETFGNRVTAFDLGPDGSLSNRRVWAQFGELPSSTVLGEGELRSVRVDVPHAGVP